MVDGIIDRLMSIGTYHNHVDVRSIDDSAEDPSYDLTGILRKRVPFNVRVLYDSSHSNSNQQIQYGEVYDEVIIVGTEPFFY